jgi:predicted ArsR family transcriptional regulator
VAPEEPTTTPEPVPADFDAQVTGIATLAEPVRRALYRYVVAQVGPVNRDQAAAGTGVARHVAKFHLDKLVEEGLLEVGYSRPPGRSGPGAGRPAKLYRRSSRELAVSLPQRDYELAGRLLARAVTVAERDHTSVGKALRDAAQEVGRSLGQRARDQAGTRPSRSAVLAATTSVLRECGYEPRPDATGVTLANCPFHALAQDYTDLVCGMNLELMSGLVDGLHRDDLHARLEPTPGQCCVHLGTTDRARPTARQSEKEAT